MRLWFAGLLITVAASLGGGCRREASVSQPDDPAAATRQLVNLLNVELRVRMRRFVRESQDVPDARIYLEIARGEGNGPDNPFEDESVSLRRARVLARLDLIRSAFPQFFCELVPQPKIATGLSTGVLARSMAAYGLPAPGTDPYRSPALGTAGPATDHRLVASLRDTFLSQASVAPNNDEQSESRNWFYPAGHDPLTESSECLYLILNHPDLGTPLGAEVDARFVADKDDDGLLEFVDGFGNPLRYYRWPTDYYAYRIDVEQKVDSEYPQGLGADDRYQKAAYADALAEAGLDERRLLYAANWFDAHRWRDWDVPQAVFRQENAAAWQVLTYRTHQLYDIRRSNLVTELYLSPPAHFPAVDFGFGMSGKQITTNDDLSDFPRWYPTEPLVVSAGPDGRFGLYTPDADNLHGDRPVSLPPPLPMWAALQLDYRCGRVDARYREFVADNIAGWR